MDPDPGKPPHGGRVTGHNVSSSPKLNHQTTSSTVNTPKQTMATDHSTQPNQEWRSLPAINLLPGRLPQEPHASPEQGRHSQHKACAVHNSISPSSCSFVDIERFFLHQKSVTLRLDSISAMLSAVFGKTHRLKSNNHWRLRTVWWIRSGMGALDGGGRFETRT